MTKKFIYYKKNIELIFVHKKVKKYFTKFHQKTQNYYLYNLKFEIQFIKKLRGKSSNFYFFIIQ
jgi:hypothetical protein